MCKEFSEVVHILLAAALATMILADLHQNGNTSYCGSPEKSLTEEDTCYVSGADVPCPNQSKINTTIKRRCRPTYISNPYSESVQTVLFICREDGWKPFNRACYADCGVPTKNNNYPWIVAIYDSTERLVCSGTIITETLIVSVATCFDVDRRNNNTMNNAANYTIVAGRHYTNIHRMKESAQVAKIRKSWIHPDFIFLEGNIIVIEIEPKFKFSDDVREACIDWYSFYDVTDFRDGNEAVAVGWKFDEAEMVPCIDPNEFNVHFWQPTTCTKNLPSIVDGALSNGDRFCGTYINDSSKCANRLGVGLFFKSNPLRYYLKGIYNLGIWEAHWDVTFVWFTKISFFFDWLKNITGNRYPFTRGAHLSTRDAGCKLPEHIKYGRFRWIFGKAYRVNAWVPSDSVILLDCFSNIDAPISIRCVNGAWMPPIDKQTCRRPGSCPAIYSSTSEDVLCRLNGRNVDCADPDINTTAVIRCKPFHTISGSKPIYKCQNGEWDQPFTRCTLECGTKRVGVTTLAIGGSEAIKNEYPWVVAIYRSTEQVCGGTIISRYYVLSAAHCFTTPKGVAVSTELFTIIAGKHYRNFSTEESSAQSRKIKFVYIHDDYKGSLQKFRDDIALIELDAEFTPSLEVQPVCLDWENLYEDFDFIDGNKAVVAGWGYTKESGSPSDVLRKLILPYRSKDVCMANLPEDFSHQYVATDKICAGYKDNNMNVCQGDSGGGLYFRSDDNRFYVRGIVSLTVKTQVGGCQANSFALYTKVSKYLPWIETITRRVL